MTRSRKGVGNLAFAATAVILVVLVVIGFSLYATKAPSTVTSIQTSVLTSVQTSVQTSAVTHTITETTSVPSSAASAGFYNGNVITFSYTAEFVCTPSLSTFFSNESKADSVAQGCEVGAADKSNFPSNAAPVYVLVPAFAGLSIFGVTSLGATAQGFPTFTYDNQTMTVATQCGASLTKSGCPDHMPLIYSPDFTAVEQHLGIKNGVFGLPEGVLPTPAHSHLVTFTDNQSIPWYIVVVLVFNPNIFPEPLTGQCRAVVPSNQSNPTADCLNSYAALQAALTTHDTAVSAANANNPIWQTLGGPTVDIVVPGATTVSQLSTVANSNMLLYFSDPSTFP
ncbi:MAG: hypothetical protein QW767_00690 [Thermoprotei archaeon]